MNDDDAPDRSLPARVRDRGLGALRSAGSTGRRVPTALVDLVSDRLDEVAARVAVKPSPVRTADQLHDALVAVRSEKGGAASMASLLTSTGLARRTLGIGTKRVPLLAAATGTATALTSIARGIREVRLLASHLVHRAQAAGVTVDAGALRTVVLHLYLRPNEDPARDAPPPMLVTRVVTTWVRTATAEALPLVPDRMGRPKVRTWVDAAGRVDVTCVSRDGSAMVGRAGPGSPGPSELR